MAQASLELWLVRGLRHLCDYLPDRLHRFGWID